MTAHERRAHGGTLILGGGFAGSWVARLLGKRGAETTIVCPENFMLFTPLLPEAASGTLEPRHIVVPLRMMCPRSELLLGRATAVHQERRAVTVETQDATLEVAYERLVIALGAVSRALPIPGLAEHGHGFKDLADAIALRNHVLRQLELADAAQDAGAARRHLTFVFVGAGYAGVEALAELSDLVRDALRYYPRLREIPARWLLVDAAPSILPEIPTKLGAYAARELTGRGVEIRTGTTLQALDADGAMLSNGYTSGMNGLAHPAGNDAIGFRDINPPVRVGRRNLAQRVGVLLAPIAILNLEDPASQRLLEALMHRLERGDANFEDAGVIRFHVGPNDEAHRIVLKPEGTLSTR
jgi:NADH dehydrogenase